MAEANPTNLSDEDPTKMCDPCSFRGLNTQAGTYCQACAYHMCDTCEAVHRSSKELRDHALKPIVESRILSIEQKALISSIMTCDVHRTDTLTLFCVNHSSTICSACKSSKHRKCTTKPLTQVTKEAKIKKDVYLYTQKSKVLLSVIRELKDSREKEKRKIQDCSRICIEQVKKTKLQIIAWAEKMSKDMEDKIANIENRVLAETEGEINAVVEINTKMQDIVKSFEILGQDIENVTCVLMMKEKVSIEDSIEMIDDLLTQGQSVTLEFQPSEKLVTVMSEITSMGKLEVNEKQISKSETIGRQEHQICFQDISSTTNKKHISSSARGVTGCTFMPDGELVICDYDNDYVKIFTIDLKLKNKLKIESGVWDVAVVSRNEIIVTEPHSNSLMFLTVSNNIMIGKGIHVGIKCWGIDCKNEKLYISCHEDDGTAGMVKVLTMDGVTVNTFNISHRDPSYLAVSSSGDRILVSCSYNGVLCIDNTGKTMYTYNDKMLDGSLGLLFDSYDNFMVCSESSNTLHVVKSNGTRHMILLTRDDGLDDPQCLAYRPSDNTLVIGQNNPPNSRLGALKKKVFKSCPLLAKTVVWSTDVRN